MNLVTYCRIRHRTQYSACLCEIGDFDRFLGEYSMVVAIIVPTWSLFVK